MAQDGSDGNELERLLASDFLRRSPSHLRLLLRYLVERRLASDDGALREMSIGIGCFSHRPFDVRPEERSHRPRMM